MVIMKLLCLSTFSAIKRPNLEASIRENKESKVNLATKIVFIQIDFNDFRQV